MIFLRTRFHRLASRDYLNAMRRYSRQSTRAADRFILAMDAALRQILENPLLCVKHDDQFRWKPWRRFPFVLYFEILDEATIHVIAVAHKDRRPGYWKGRAKKP